MLTKSPQKEILKHIRLNWRSVYHTWAKTSSNVTGMGGLPFGGQSLGMGEEKSNAKYGECLLASLHFEAARKGK